MMRIEFRSRVACENDKLKLECNPYSRIAIYGAIFGRSEEENVAICSKNPDGNRNEPKHPSCLVSYATETVMQICHGRRRCELIADVGTFGKPCSDNISMYLKVVYTCIPRKVLKDRFETIPEPDEPQQSELDFDDDDFYDENQVYNIPEGIPQVPKGPPVLPIGFEFGDIIHHTSTLMPPLSQNDNLE
uniref:SUEL-type lectin domain-containing protein n=1 Tax=Megaselia scalaris TaxID=36166 RepID=T1GKU1_MEGSC